MARFRTQITTHLPLDQVFSDLSRFDHAAAWDPGVAEGSMLTPEPVQAGSRFALKTRFLGRTLPLEYEVVELEPGARIVVRAENAFVRSTDTISFESGAGEGTPGPPAARTTVTYDARLEPKGAARLAGPLLALAFRRIGDRAADGLRRHLGAVRA